MNHDDLRAKAMAATPGPWEIDEVGDIMGRAGTQVVGHVESAYGDGEANADFIAAASPDVVIWLLDEIERLRAEIAEARNEAATVRRAYLHERQRADTACCELINSPIPAVSERGGCHIATPRRFVDMSERPKLLIQAYLEADGTLGDPIVLGPWRAWGFSSGWSKLSLEERARAYLTDECGRRPDKTQIAALERHFAKVRDEALEDAAEECERPDEVRVRDGVIRVAACADYVVARIRALKAPAGRRRRGDVSEVRCAECERRIPKPHCWECVIDREYGGVRLEDMFDAGAAVAFGLLGMAEAIRKRRWKCPTCRCMPSIMVDRCTCCADGDFQLEEDEREF